MKKEMFLVVISYFVVLLFSGCAAGVVGQIHKLRMILLPCIWQGKEVAGRVWNRNTDTMDDKDLVRS